MTTPEANPESAGTPAYRHLSAVPEPVDDVVPVPDVDEADELSVPAPERARIDPDILFWIALWGPCAVCGLVMALLPLIGSTGVIVMAAVLIWVCIGTYTWKTWPR